jgi:hypothetical protein
MDAVSIAVLVVQILDFFGAGIVIRQMNRQITALKGTIARRQCEFRDDRCLRASSLHGAAAVRSAPVPSELLRSARIGL